MIYVKFPIAKIDGSFPATCEEFLKLALLECGYGAHEIRRLQPRSEEERDYYTFEVDLYGSHLDPSDEKRLRKSLAMADFNDIVIER